jgi:hypothetical protein
MIHVGSNLLGLTIENCKCFTVSHIALEDRAGFLGLSVFEDPNRAVSREEKVYLSEGFTGGFLGEQKFQLDDFNYCHPHYLHVPTPSFCW